MEANQNLVLLFQQVQRYSAHKQDLPPRVKWETPTNEILSRIRTCSFGPFTSNVPFDKFFPDPVAAGWKRQLLANWTEKKTFQKVCLTSRIRTFVWFPFRSIVPFGKSFLRSSSRAAGVFSSRRLENSLSSAEALNCHMYSCVAGVSLLI